LVSESSTHPAVFRRLPGKVFLGSSIFPLGRFLEKAAGYKGRLGAGGSVATSAWDFARLLGAGPLFIAGLDLGFPDKNTHFKGSFFEDRSFSMANRFSTAETHSVSYLLDGSPCCLPANDGSEVMTDKRMIIYQWWFEAQAKLHPEPKTYNLSEKGLKIEGFPVTDFKDLLSYPIMREKVDEILEKIRGLQETNFDPKYLDAAFQSLFQELIFLESATQKGLDEIERLRGLPEKDRTTDFSTLEALDREILSCENRDIAGFLLASTLTLTDDPALSKLDSLLARSERIYRDLLDSARFHRECLGEGRQR
jgi:hypothetical protein